MKGEIGYRNTKYYLTCLKKKAGFDINITSQSPEFVFSSNRYIKSGEEIELGEIINSKNSHQSEIGTSGINLGKTDQQDGQKLFLKIR